AGEADDLAVRDRQVDVVDRAHVVVGDGKPAQLDEWRACHVRLGSSLGRHRGHRALRLRNLGFETSSIPASRKTSPTTVTTSARPGKRNGHHSPCSTVELV